MNRNGPVPARWNSEFGSLEKFATSTPIAMRYTPHLLQTTALIACIAVLLLISARIAAHSLIRIAVPTRLRAAE